MCVCQFVNICGGLFHSTGDVCFQGSFIPGAVST